MGVAATRGPGLVGSLIVGLSLAKGLALACNKPLVGVHHLEAHVFSNLIAAQVAVPFLTLLVSGGHTELILVRTLGSYEVLGRTRDDAAGEAFDKVAKLLGLLPGEGAVAGGRLIAELAADGDPAAIDFPRALVGEMDFSFSGLKTSVLHYVRSLSPQARTAAACPYCRQLPRSRGGCLSRQDPAGLGASRSCDRMPCGRRCRQPASAPTPTRRGRVSRAVISLPGVRFVYG